MDVAVGEKLCPPFCQRFFFGGVYPFLSNALDYLATFDFSVSLSDHRICISVHLKLTKKHISKTKIRIKRMLSLYRCQIWQVYRHTWYARGENVLGGNSHQAHSFCSVYRRKSLKLVRLQHNRDILQGQSPEAANPIQTPTKTMYSNNSSGRAGRHGLTGARGPGRGRMPGFRSAIHYIQTKGP